MQTHQAISPGILHWLFPQPRTPSLCIVRFFSFFRSPFRYHFLRKASPTSPLKLFSLTQIFLSQPPLYSIAFVYRLPSFHEGRDYMCLLLSSLLSTLHCNSSLLSVQEMSAEWILMPHIFLKVEKVIFSTFKAFIEGVSYTISYFHITLWHIEITLIYIKSRR